jgi:hypothetical protein
VPEAGVTGAEARAENVEGCEEKLTRRKSARREPSPAAPLRLATEAISLFPFPSVSSVPSVVKN